MMLMELWFVLELHFIGFDVKVMNTMNHTSVAAQQQIYADVCSYVIGNICDFYFFADLH